MPAIKQAIDVEPIITLLGGQHNIFPVYADLPTLFPAVGLHFTEKKSIPRPAYNIFKLRDCEGELTVFIQNKTSGRDARVLKSAIDSILFVNGVNGTRNWKMVGQYDNIVNDEKLEGVAYYLQVVYSFDYTVTDA